MLTQGYIQDHFSVCPWIGQLAVVRFNHLLLFCFSFYPGDRDVQADTELQASVNELSAKGTGPDGGRGQVIKMAFVVDCTNARIYAEDRLTTIIRVGDPRIH